MAPPHHGTGKGAHRRGRSPAGQGRSQGKRAPRASPHPAIEGGPTQAAQAWPFRRGQAQRSRPNARPFRRGRAQAPPTQRRPGRFGEARPSGRGRAHPRSAGEAVSERPSPAVEGSPHPGSPLARAAALPCKALQSRDGGGRLSRPLPRGIVWASWKGGRYGANSQRRAQGYRRGGVCVRRQNVSKRIKI